MLDLPLKNDTSFKCSKLKRRLFLFLRKNSLARKKMENETGIDHIEEVCNERDRASNRLEVFATESSKSLLCHIVPEKRGGDIFTTSAPAPRDSEQG